MHYNYHRYYQSRIGRYQSSDPTGVVYGINHLYLYSSANPIKYIDLFGLAPGDVYLFTGGGWAPYIAGASPGPYGHAAIEIPGGKVLSSGNEDGNLGVYVTDIGKELSERSFDVFSPRSPIDADALAAFAERMRGKPYLPNVCSDVTAAGMAASNTDKKAYSWENYRGFVSPGDIWGDPRFEKTYEYQKSVEYKNGGYKVITPSGTYYSIRPY